MSPEGTIVPGELSESQSVHFPPGPPTFIQITGVKSKVDGLPTKTLGPKWTVREG